MAKGKTATMTAAKKGAKKHAAKPPLESKGQWQTKINQQAQTNGDVQTHVCAKVQEPLKIEEEFASGIPEYKISYAADQTLKFEPAPDSRELAVALSYHFPIENGLQGKMKAAIRNFLTGGGQGTSELQITKTEPTQTEAAPAPRAKKEVHTPAPAHLSEFENFQKGLKHVMFADLPSFITRDSTPVENEPNSWEATCVSGIALNPTTLFEFDKERSYPDIFLLGPGNDDWLNGYVGCNCCQENILEPENGCQCEGLESPFYFNNYTDDVDCSNVTDAGLSAVTDEASHSTVGAHLSANPIQIPFGISGPCEYFESPCDFCPEDEACSGAAHGYESFPCPLFPSIPTNVYCEVCGVFTGGNFDTIYPQPKVETELAFIPMISTEMHIPTPQFNQDHEIAHLEHEVAHPENPKHEGDEIYLEAKNHELSYLEHPDHELAYSENGPHNELAHHGHDDHELAHLEHEAQEDHRHLENQAQGLANHEHEAHEDRPHLENQAQELAHHEHEDHDLSHFEHDERENHELLHHPVHICCYPEGVQEQSFPFDATDIYFNSRNSCSTASTISASESLPPSPNFIPYTQPSNDIDVKILTPVSTFSLDSSSSVAHWEKGEDCICSAMSPLDIMMGGETDVEGAKEEGVVNTVRGDREAETSKAVETEKVPESAGLVVAKEEGFHAEGEHSDGGVDNLVAAFARGVALSVEEAGTDRKENWLD